IGPGRPDGGASSRFDDADDGYGELFAQHGEGVGRRGVARNHDRLDALRLEIVGDLLAVAANGVGALRAIGNASGVAEVNDTLGWKLADDFVCDGQPSNSRIEDADRGIPRSYHSMRAPTI